MKVAALEWSIVPKTTLERRQTRLSPRESERTERVARLFVHARRALGSEEEARAFVTAPHPDSTGAARSRPPGRISLRIWLEERRSALLLVPSVVTGGRDKSVVVNPNHPDATWIVVGQETPVALDWRLCGS